MAWVENDIKNEVKSKEIKRTHFSFSNCGKILKTGGIEYFALFRNNNMDLENLKADISNIEIFVIPLVNYIMANNIKSIVIAPKGSRYEKYGFHYVTELMLLVSKYTEIKVVNPFKNIRNHIIIDKDINIPKESIIFDDICTRGTTLKKMNELSGISNNLILLSNH